MEEWRDIEGYEGLYQVSNKGRVRRLDREINAYNFCAKRNIKYIKKGKILEPHLDKNGYMCINLHRGLQDHKNKKVHRLVAEAFIPNPQNLKEINHKDECKTNNVVENLEWCSRSYNVNYGTRNKRAAEAMVNHPKTSKKVYQYSMNGELVAVFNSTREAERQGYNHGCISNCINGRIKTHKECLWRYE